MVIGGPNSRQLTADTWEVWTDLLITNRYAGDNCKVKVTCGTYRESGLLTAWKRVYYEPDRMYRVGSLLTQDALAGMVEVDVEDSSVFAVGNSVRVFDALNRESGLATINAIDPVARKITLSAPRTGNYSPTNQGFVARETGNDAVDYFTPDTSGIPWTFDDVYVEFMYLVDGSEGVPRIHFSSTAEAISFRTRWFKNKGKSNYVYLVGSFTNCAGDLGWARPDHNFAYVFVDAIGVSLPLNRDVTNHELVHQFQTLAAEPGSHDEETAWSPVSEYCLMDVVDRNLWNDIIELELSSVPHAGGSGSPTYHVYKVRDWVDDI